MIITRAKTATRDIACAINRGTGAQPRRVIEGERGGPLGAPEFLLHRPTRSNVFVADNFNNSPGKRAGSRGLADYTLVEPSSTGNFVPGTGAIKGFWGGGTDTSIDSVEEGRVALGNERKSKWDKACLDFLKN